EALREMNRAKREINNANKAKEMRKSQSELFSRMMHAEKDVEKPRESSKDDVRARKHDDGVEEAMDDCAVEKKARTVKDKKNSAAAVLTKQETQAAAAVAEPKKPIGKKAPRRAKRPLL